MARPELQNLDGQLYYQMLQEWVKTLRQSQTELPKISCMAEVAGLNKVQHQTLASMFFQALAYLE